MPATGENEIDPKDRNKEIRIVMGERLSFNLPYLLAMH